MIDNDILVGTISIRHRADNDFWLLFGGVFENKIFLDAENDYMNRYWITI